MNMFKPTKATSVQEYLAAVPPEQREAMDFLHDFIQKTAPTLTSHFANNMLGYGTFAYTNSKKQVGEWHTIGLANQKKYISVYVCCIEDGEYLAEKNKAELGNVTVGKSCISFKNLNDLNLETFKKVLKAAEKNPGLTGLKRN
jgi:hypothetical protein